MLNLQKSKQHQSGFTFVELIVTMAMFSVMITGIIKLYVVIGATQQKSSHIETANRAGEAKIESLRNLQYSNLDTDNPIDFTSELPDSLPQPKSGIIQVSEPEPGLKRVDLTITYGTGSKAQTINQSSYIGILGIAQ
ncbi:prepilin-type N-terminal cleavage/methylation domain-containing protein [Candidatus Saccharibacteria bacterium]|nr:prepilin-type N-terminal cleavage/methylation domain-containing protein [Candidatus Saccharibacteria bacterium]